MLDIAVLLFECLDEKLFDFIPGPRGFAKKGEGGFDRGIVGEAADTDAIREFVPAVFLYQAGNDYFQGIAVQGIVGVVVHRKEGGLILEKVRV